MEGELGILLNVFCESVESAGFAHVEGHVYVDRQSWQTRNVERGSEKDVCAAEIVCMEPNDHTCPEGYVILCAQDGRGCVEPYDTNCERDARKRR